MRFSVSDLEDQPQEGKQEASNEAISMAIDMLDEAMNKVLATKLKGQLNDNQKLPMDGQEEQMDDQDLPVSNDGSEEMPSPPMDDVMSDGQDEDMPPDEEEKSVRPKFHIKYR